MANVIRSGKAVYGTASPYAASPAQTISAPDKGNARKTVLVMGVILFAYVLATQGKNVKTTTGLGGALQTTGNTFVRIAATAYVVLFLALLADFAPQVAGPMSVLIVLGLIITPQGQAALNRLPIGNTATKNTVVTKPNAPQNSANAAQ